MPKHHFSVSQLNKLGLFEVSPGVFSKCTSPDNKYTTSSKKVKVKTKKVPKVDPFIMFVKQELGVDLVPEYKFHSSRKWRFDYAIPDKKIAIECEGGIWMKKSRHISGKGYKGDMEKYNAAVELGWKLLRFTPDELLTIDCISSLNSVIYAKK